MGIFGNIMSAIFGSGSAQAQASPTADPSAPPAQTVDVAAIFDEGERTLKKKEAAKLLMDQTGLGRTVCYDALKLAGGEFSDYLDEGDGVLRFRR